MVVTAGTALLALAALASALAAVALFYDYVRETDAFGTASARAAAVATGALVVAWAYLTYQFVVGDYTNAYVWENSAEHLSVLYRVTGVYASNEGSILFWALLTSVVATWTLYAAGFDGRGSKLVQSISMGIVAAFAIMLVGDSPFTPISVAFPEVSEGFVPPDGDGLNPLLIDPYMAIHPPITFAAYAFLILPFALGVTHFVSLLRGRESVFDEWVDPASRWLRTSWLLLTAAIALGGIWAYRVLGWGGFWSWDPVETAVLIPWLALTAALHAFNRYRTTGEYPVFAPAAAAFVFPLVIYATVVVRSDVFRSVHSFSAGGIGTGILAMLIVTMALAIVLPFTYWFFHAEEGGRDGPWLSRRTVYHGAVLAFALLAFVSLWGLTFPVLRSAATGVEVSVDDQYYNMWSYPIVVLALLAGGLYAILDTRRRTLAIRATAAVAVVTVLAAFVAPSGNWYLHPAGPHDPLYYRLVGSVSVLSIVPPAAFFAGAWSYRFLSRARGVPSRSFQAREAGVLLIHVGAAVLIVAVSFVYLFATSATVAFVGIDEASENPEVMVEEVPDSEYEVHLKNYETRGEPTIEETARTPAELLAVDEDPTIVRGEITDVEVIEGVTFARLDGSTVWLATDDPDAPFEVGEELFARGPVYEDVADGIDAAVFTDGDNVGPANEPPEELNTPQVTHHELHVALYEDGERVTEGVVREQEFQRHEMNTNDVLIERGVTGDTYVLGTLTPAGASITVDTYPLANQIWLGVSLMLVGMSAVFLAEPRVGGRNR